MTRITFIIGFFTICYLSSCEKKQTSSIDSRVFVSITIADSVQLKGVDIQWTDGMTALTALQCAATVETHPVGKHVFVTAIDTIKGRRGLMAWYYKVNGKNADKLAMSNTINPNDTITWIYTKDICSATVDCKKR